VRKNKIRDAGRKKERESKRKKERKKDSKKERQKGRQILLSVHSSLAQISLQIT